MIGDDIQEAVADALWTAQVNRSAIDPISERYPGLDAADAYAIQSRNIRRSVLAGDRIVGHKIGLTSAVMQEMMGVDAPDFGHLLESMMVDVRSPISLRPYIQPRVEVEIAFVLGEDLPMSGCTVADVLRSTQWLVPCLELIDSRISDWRINLVDTVADNASSAGVILGSQRIRPADLDGAGVRARLEINGAVVAGGSTNDVIGTPAGAVAWLANTVGGFGVALRAGHVVLSGSCTRAIDIAPGDVVTATFEGFDPLVARFTS